MIQRKWYIALIMFFAFMPVSYGVIRTINLASSSQVSGILPLANGGTGTSTGSTATTTGPTTMANGAFVDLTHPTITTGARYFASLYDSVGAQNSLLLHFDGSNASTTFTDSTGRNTVTAAGNAQLTTTGAKIGTASLILDGSGDHATIPTSAMFGFGTADFSIEAWVWLDAITGAFQTVMEARTSATAIPWTLTTTATTGKIRFTDGSINVDGATTLTAGVWNHIAASRTNGVVTVWLNGVSDGSGTMTTDLGSTCPLKIGDSIVTNTGALAGKIDEIYITKG